MNVNECIRSRRSIRKYQSRLVDHSIIDSIVSDASYSPSWKNTQITRYIAIEDLSILETIAEQFTPDYNSNIIKQIPVLFVEHILTDIIRETQLFRGDQYKTDPGVAYKCVDQRVDGTTEFQVAAQTDR